MGCDIHLYTERRRSINNEEKWVCADLFVLNPYYTPGNTDEEKQYTARSFVKRNYGLFSMLANVRNYRDNPFMEAKGLPEDANEFIVQENERWGSDGHSHSWLTMRELYEFFDANPTQKYAGLVDEKGAAAIDAGGEPEWYCQGSTDESLIWREWDNTNETMKCFIEGLEKDFYRTDYYDKERDADKFRIVFWFDN